MSNIHYPTYVVFGATGDLAQRKIIPALLSLFIREKIPLTIRIIAFSRRAWTDIDYKTFIKPALHGKGYDEAQLESFLNHIEYVKGTFDDDSGFNMLAQKIQSSEAFFHLAIQPEYYESVVKRLHAAGCSGKLLIEKPFGQDLASAEKLETAIESVWDKNTIFRIDHYLAKEGLQAMIDLRKKDEQLDAWLSHENVESVHAVLFEKIGIEGRGEFYETVGALKDVGQNHILEMLAAALMNIPQDDHEIPLARAEFLSKLSFNPKTFVRGQYVGYRDEQDVKPDSETETYFKAEGGITNDRWKGVKIIIEGGKGMMNKQTYIECVGKDGSRMVFDIDKKTEGRDAYEILIEKALHGNKVFFVSYGELIASWRSVQPLLEAQVPIKTYNKEMLWK